MIIELYDEGIFTVPTEMILCPTTPSGVTEEADKIGFNRVHPEIATAVREASEHNDMPAGVLMSLRAENSARKELLVGVPMTPHSREPLSPFFLQKAMKSLRILINKSQVKRVTLPISAFCDMNAKARLSDFSDEGHGIQALTKYMLIKELMLLEASLYDEVEFILVH